MGTKHNLKVRNLNDSSTLLVYKIEIKHT